MVKLINVVALHYKILTSVAFKKLVMITNDEHIRLSF